MTGQRRFVKSFKNILLLITAVATSIAAYVAYKSYIEQPRLVVSVFKVTGDEEVYYSSGEVELRLRQLNRTAEAIEYELPLKVVNEGEKDADGITIWMRVEGGEMIPAEMYSERYADKDWKIWNIEKQSPKSGIKIYGVGVRVHEGTKEVRLLWKVHSYHAQPCSGSVLIRLV